MIRLLLIAVGVMLSASCATHDYRVRGDTLELVLNKPEATAVALACSLDGFESHAARKINGRWVVILPAGIAFRYYYILDGAPYSPPCRMRENDDFGSVNCIYDPLR